MMKNQVKPVLCVGDLVVDIVTKPVTQMPLPGEPIVTDSITVLPGGNSLNTAVALRRMGDMVSVAGSIGNDDLGKLLLQHLKGLGLDVSGVVAEHGESTASTIILRVEGEDRRYIMNLGVGKRFTGKLLSFDLIPENGVVLAGGFLKLSAWDDQSLLDFLQEAQRRRNKTVLNVCLVQNSDVNPSRVLSLLEHVDVFLPNEDEAGAITGEKMIEDQAKRLLRSGVKNVVITRGDKGLYASDGKSGIHLGAYDVHIVDPSGCGDCFTAGMIAGLRRDWDLLKTLQFGSATGALGATALGCTTGIPSFKKIDEFIDRHSIEISQIRIS
jgi:sugar/nucleoside kinase (ribokinase family)